jgi:hypothetical protein
MSFGFGGTASHCFGGGLTGRSLSHAWSMGSGSNNSDSSSQSSSTSLIGSLVALDESIRKQQQRVINETLEGEDMKEQETKSQAVPINVPKYFSFKQHYPGNEVDKKSVTLKVTTVQYIEEDQDGIFKINTNDGSWFPVDEKTAKELNDILYSL